MCLQYAPRASRAARQGTVQVPRCTHPELVFGSLACRYTDLAPLKPLNTTLIMNETELPEVTIAVYPTAHCEFVRVVDDPIGFVVSVVAALL
jgi:hypothetical protein